MIESLNFRSMRHKEHRYLALDDLYIQKDAVAWYWRAVALAASWMILGGYLILPMTFDTEPKLRFSSAALSIIIVALLTAGYSLTALLWFAIKSWLFHSESIFLPAFCSSLLGLLTVVWCFLSSTRYTFSTTAVVSVCLASVSTVIYGSLVLKASRRISRIRRTQQTMQGTTTGGLWQEPTYYSNYIANMHPTARNNSAGLPLTEEELVQRQMARLLTTTDPAPTPDASQGTFRIEWPDEDGDNTHERLRAGNLAAPENVRSPPGRTNSAGSHSRPSIWNRIAGGSEERGRSALKVGSSHDVRPKSREDRRREIELGTLN